MVRAAKTNGIRAPTNRPVRTTGLSNDPSPIEIPASSANALINATEVKTADPMANPLPVAAVVLPNASRASVISRTESGISSPAISAIPPALSDTGP
jgi:hypothetical protein